MIVNINTYSDVAFNRTFIYEDASLEPIDLTGSTLRMHVRARAEDATVFMDLSNADGDLSAIVIISPVAGMFRITIPYSVLLRLPAATYVHSLVRNAPGVVREEIWRGTLTHAIGPTRSADVVI